MKGFFPTHTGDEIDLVIEGPKKKRIGFEFKTSSAPKLTKQNYAAMELLNLEKMFVITPDSDEYILDEKGSLVMSLKNYLYPSV